MSTLIRSAATPVWLLLMAATVAGYAIGEDRPFGLSPGQASVTVLALALVKIRFIVRYFMEIRHAPLPLKFAFDAWIVVAGISTIGIYLIS